MTALAVFIVCFTGAAAPLTKEFSFMGLKLGMTESEVTDILTRGSMLQIDESRYFGKINEAVPFIIKADYYPFIDGVYIQFYNNSAYGITIQFNQGYFDFFSIFDKLRDKYGPPSIKTSKLVLWDESASAAVSNAPLLSPSNSIQSNSVMTDSALTNPASSVLNSPNSGTKLRLEFPSTVKVINYDIMQKVNSELSQNTVRITNESIIQSNRRALLDEF